MSIKVPLEIRDIYTLLIFSIITIIAMLNITPYGAASTTDSFAYVEAAENFNAGKGVSLNSYAMGQESEIVLFTTWPPLYPIAIAPFLSSDIQPMYAVAQLSILLLLISVLFCFLFFKKLGGYWLATLGTALFLTASSTVVIFTYAWSETLFTAFVVLACWSIIYCIESAQKEATLAHLFYLCILTLCVIGMFYTRYAGIWLGILIPATWWVLPNKRKWLITYLIAGLVSAAAIGYLMWQNYILVGDISGGDFNTQYNEVGRVFTRPNSPTDLVGRLIELKYALLALLPLKLPIYLLSFLVGIAALFALFKWQYGSILTFRHESAEIPFYGKKLIFISVMGILAYTAGFLYMGVTKNLLAYDVRYFGLLTPLFITILVSGFAYVWHLPSKIFSGLGAGLISLVILGILFQGSYYYYNGLVNLQKEPTGLYATDTTETRFFSNSTLSLEKNPYYHLIRELASHHQQLPVFFVEQPRFVHFIAAYSPIKLFPIQINDDSIKQMNNYVTNGNGYVLLVTRAGIDKLVNYYGMKKLMQLPYHKGYLESSGILLIQLPLPLNTEVVLPAESAPTPAQPPQ
ncbi:hypothetical protein BegalDRAFT_0400 [Beggiatoa alba B18LD]|uniref:Glycosyltransferase RgtA/B/C/D-like domain-containing protein n=1 Tax=Beggiatoa alba B18LD TaxID=395493 RepID=I3CCH7_9GAMM|nr:hypothetical protein [Beggiatoa alba]EIJ41320.1 hypothetical protein BegalDRAFT_0400 [Beggiatoa alba B18LD]